MSLLWVSKEMAWDDQHHRGLCICLVPHLLGILDERSTRLAARHI